MRLHSLGCLLLFTSLTSAQVDLRWKLDKQDPLYFRTVMHTRQKLSLKDPRPGNPDFKRKIFSEFIQTVTFSYTFKGKGGDGNYQIVQKILEVTTKAPTATDGRKHTELEDVELTLHVNAQAQVVKLEGYQKLVKALVGDEGGNDRKQMIQGALSEQALKDLAQHSLSVVPNKAAKVGETWSRSPKLSLGPLGTVTVNHVHKYEGNGEGDKKELAKIQVTSKMTRFEPSTKETEQLRITKANLKGSGDGVIYFDAKNGHLVELETTTTLTGSLSIKIDINTRDAELEQTQVVRTKVSSKNPLEKESP